MGKLTIPANIDRLDDVIDFLHAELEPFKPAKKLFFDLDLVAEEVFVNIAHYAYSDRDDSSGEASVDFAVDPESRQITLTFADSGRPFDPTAAPPPDLLLPVDERPIGGLGIFLVKKIMDSVEYSRENGCNVLTLKKTYTQED